MKKCMNPKCNTGFLFGDDKVVCPFCHSELVPNETGETERFLMPADRIREEKPMSTQKVRFVEERLGDMVCRGRIVEIDHHELFYSPKLKIFNTLFRGEPYQLGHQTVEYTIRLENLTDGFPMEVKDFCLYGSYLGRMQVGDEAMIRAKNLQNRRVVKSIYNRTTETLIKPGLQIPAAVVRPIIISILMIILWMIGSAIWLVKSGAVSTVLMGILDAVIPIILVLFAIIAILKDVFRSIFRR